MSDDRRYRAFASADPVVSNLKRDLALAEADATRLAGEIAALEKDRGARLLDGASAEVEAAESKLAKAQADAGRVSAILPVLRDRLAAAERAERVEIIKALHAECARDEEAFRTWFHTHYANLAASIAAGLQVERDVFAKKRKLITLALAAGFDLGELPRLAGCTADLAWNDKAPKHARVLGGVGDFVQLPPAVGSPKEAAPIWPPRA